MKKFEFCVYDNEFKKSSFTHRGGLINRCVEVAIKPEGIAVRNSNDPTKNTVFFTREEWEVFLKGIQNGEFKV